MASVVVGDEGLGLSSWPKDLRPPIASYSPSIWGDIFTSFSLDDQVQEKYAIAIEELKEEARSMLMAEGSTIKDKLVLIDTLERLGVAYHFEQEIEHQLQQIFEFQSEDYDLFTTALQFRLLRQHRHHVSCSVFDKFKGIDNKFDESHSSDAKGLLSLYEALHVRIHGEDILEEALAFTTHNLNRMVEQLESALQDIVKRALKQSLHRGVSRIETRHFISFYEKDDSKNEQLLKLAKLDFNYVQNLYKQELNEVSRWWNKFDLKSKLLHARDRVVECYFWGVAFRYEPKYSYVRIAIAKSMQLCSVIDDTYDNYATLEEADLFTEALERWNIDAIDQLPEVMKVVYKFTLSIYEDYEREAAERGKSFATPYAIESVKQLGRAYNKELKWFMGRQMPSFDEYFANTEITSCIFLMFTSVIPGMESVSNKETIDWIISMPKIALAASQMCRYLEDLTTHQREEKGGQMLTAVDCYMKEYGVSKKETLGKFVELIDYGWKDMNTAWITKTSIPKDMVEQFLNYARVAEVTYKNGEDGYSNPETCLAPQIAALFVDPIDI